MYLNVPSCAFGLSVEPLAEHDLEYKLLSFSLAREPSQILPEVALARTSINVQLDV